MQSKILVLVAIVAVLLFGSVTSAVATSTDRLVPTITEVQPNWALHGDLLWVSISGQETHFAQGSPLVWLSQASSTINAGSIGVETDTHLHAYFTIPYSAPSGAWNVSVKVSSYLTVTLYGGFTIDPPPQITSINPDSADRGSDLWVSISGANTYFGMGSSTLAWLWFSQGSSGIYINASSVNVADRYNVSAHFAVPENAELGYWDLTVFTAGYPSPTRTDGFKIYTPGRLTAISPDSAVRNDDFWVTISGENTHFGQGSGTSVWFRQASSSINSDAVNVASPMQLSAHFNIDHASPVGRWDVLTHDNIYPPLVMADSFTILAVCGDLDGSDDDNIADVVYMLNYIFAFGPAPTDFGRGDVNCTGDLNIADAVYYINYVFGGGPALCAGCK